MLTSGRAASVLVSALVGASTVVGPADCTSIFGVATGSELTWGPAVFCGGVGTAFAGE
jgi:hypothetical protein